MSTPTTLKRRPGQKYTAEQRRHGFIALAQCNGSSRLAARLLEEQGQPIPRETLRWWADHNPDELIRVEKEVEERIWSRTSRHWRRVIEDAAQGATEAIEATREEMKADPKLAKTYSSIAKNLATAGGIATDKAAGIDGRPMNPVDHKGIAEVLRSLNQHPGILKVNGYVDSTAKDVTPYTPSLAASVTSRSPHTPEQTEPSSSSPTSRPQSEESEPPDPA